ALVLSWRLRSSWAHAAASDQGYSEWEDAMSSPDPGTRRRAFERCIAEVRSSRSKYGCAAAIIIATNAALFPEEALAVLEAAATDREPQVRQHGICGLSHMHPVPMETIRLLESALLDPDNEVGDEAMDAFRTIGPAARREAIPFLHTNLSHANHIIRYRAAW